MRKQRQDHLLRKEPQGYKEYKYLYREMLKEDVIRKAYKKLRKGKTKRKEIQYIDWIIVNIVDTNLYNNFLRAAA